MNQAINIIFDGPPGPESGRFIEVETDDGASVGVGEWIDKKDGLWALRIDKLPQEPCLQTTEEQHDKILDLIDKLPSRFFQGDPGWKDVVKELYELTHPELLPHPLVLPDACKKVIKLRRALAGLVGASDKEPLIEIGKMVMRTTAPESDKAAALHAIRTLIEIPK